MACLLLTLKPTCSIKNTIIFCSLFSNIFDEYRCLQTSLANIHIEQESMEEIWNGDTCYSNHYCNGKSLFTFDF